MIQSGGLLGRFPGPLLKTVLQLMKNIIKPLLKSVLVPLGLTAASSSAEAGIHKKILGSGTTTLTTSNDEMGDIMASLENSGLLLKRVTKTIQVKQKNKKENLGMLLGTLGASLLGNMLAVKEQ